MNLQLGGGGGFDNVPFEIQQEGRRKGAANLAKRLMDDAEFASSISNARSISTKRNLANGKLDNFKNSRSFLGRKHSAEAISNMKIAAVGKQSGKKNSQFGTMWISNIETFTSTKVDKNRSIIHPWVKGKNTWNSIAATKDLAVRKAADLAAKEMQAVETKNKLSMYYEIYSEHGFNEFVRLTGYDKSIQNLVQHFAKHLDNYVPQNGKKRGQNQEPAS
jgi:hypothetical protein